MQWGSYGLKLLVPNPYLFRSLVLTSASFKVQILYNPIHKGRVGHGAFFLLCSPVDNPVGMWYATYCMINLSVENLNSSCGGFSALNILMKVLLGEAYQSKMLSNACILLGTSKVDPVEISSCTMGWWSGQTASPWLLSIFTQRTTYNKRSQLPLMVSMSNPCQGTVFGQRLHQASTWTYRISLVHIYVEYGHLIHEISAEEPTCLICWKAFLHFPTDLTKHPNSAEGSSFSLDHTSDMRIWLGFCNPSWVTSSCRPIWVSSWTSMAFLPNASWYL